MPKLGKTAFDPRLFHGIAHRGYHDEVAPENSFAAFKKAIEANLPFECDVHLTKDGEIVICHDSLLKRMTGKEGKIEELTLAELRKDYKLPDGSDLPLLKDVIEYNEERVPIVVEIKVVDHNHAQIAPKVLEIVDKIRNKHNVSIISFDWKCLKLCRGHGITLGLLICKKYAFVLALRDRFDYLDVEDCLVNYYRVTSYRRHGGLVNVWTVDTEEKLKEVKGKVDMITFQHLPLDKVEDAHHK